jgi:DNA repair exonuclease SbcCD ATPase subunit
MTIAKIKERLPKIKDRLPRIRDQLRLGRKTESDALPEPDPRDAKIERLERELTAEQEHTAKLRSNVDELHFKIEILEKSYSKQLQDARQRAEQAEQGLAEQKARVGEIDGAKQTTAQSLSEAKAELERVTAERDRLRRALDPATPRHPDPCAPDDAGLRPEALSIDEILEDALWAREQQKINKARGAAHGRETESQEGPVEDMLAPDAVFAPKDAGDDK